MCGGSRSWGFFLCRITPSQLNRNKHYRFLTTQVVIHR
jgi:hypothetical protein